ncbi:MAG: response regulator, partial [Opitutales bacterium]
MKHIQTHDIQTHELELEPFALQIRLGLVVRDCRQELGLTQEELAWRAKMHRTYLAGIERGARNITLRSAANLAKALQSSVGSLLSSATRPGHSPANALSAQEIILIEDSVTDVKLTQRAFTAVNVVNPLRVLGSAEAGLEYLHGLAGQQSRPQLILLDLNLPGMSGLECLRRLKDDRRTRQIPVAILTVSEHDRDIIACGQLGAIQYIVKPVGFERLGQVTRQLNLRWALLR